MSTFKNVVGQRFNRLTVLSLNSKRINKGTKTTFVCLCDCGSTKVIEGSSVICGRIKSCGCLQKEKASQLRRKNPGIAGFNDVKKSYKRHAKQRNLIFDLQDEELKKLFSTNCYYCGSSPKNIWRYNKCTTEYSKNNIFIYNGIDRINNNEGYKIDNCVSCCSDCNWMKRDLDIKNFLEHVKKISNHSKENLSLSTTTILGLNYIFVILAHETRGHDVTLLDVCFTTYEAADEYSKKWEKEANYEFYTDIHEVEVK